LGFGYADAVHPHDTPDALKNPKSCPNSFLDIGLSLAEGDLDDAAEIAHPVRLG
jgi:hypothetical protein